MSRVSELLNQIIEDEPDFAIASPAYPSLEAMLEKQITRLKFVWKIG